MLNFEERNVYSENIHIIASQIKTMNTIISQLHHHHSCKQAS